MMKLRFSALLPAVLLAAASLSAQNAPWSAQKANDWYAKQPWLVGGNYIPANSINQLEMWQAETFDPARIELELGWAESIGMNTMRVFLHDLVWQEGSEGFKKRIDMFLTIAAKHHIKPMLVLFDSCWDPTPVQGKQHGPVPGVHNSGWVQSPGIPALQDLAQEVRLEAYVKGVVGAFGQDPRVLAWDLWNEPDNPNTSSYGSKEPKEKADLVLALMPKVFAWARAVKPTQPLTSGVWKGDWSSLAAMGPMGRAQIELSDVISFHSYDKPDQFEKKIAMLEKFGKPLICTEYMARGNGSTFEGSLPIAKKHHVAAINWGFVAGRTQTYLPWDSWQKPYVDRESAVWFHEVFRTDGTPYNPKETALIKELTAAR
jgi:hypothetical protein